MSDSPLKKHRIPLNVSSWIAFAISLAIYWITADPGVSYWDCPEYVTIASRMEIGHPPGNPIWMLAMRMATIPFPAETHAYVINLCSGLFMAFAVFFLCRMIFIVSRALIHKNRFKRISPRLYDFVSAFIALGGSLCFAFCDSVWFSAVEAEVYAMSAFLSSLSLWIMVKWWFEPAKPKQARLLILLAYITGLSLGVHQLNLLLIPVFTLIILYKYHPRRINPGIVLLYLVGACGLIGVILVLLIPGILRGAQSFELLGVNILGLPFNSGVIVFCILIFVLLLILLILSSQNNSFLRFSHVPFWILGFLLLGFSSYGIILIRAKAYPPMNEGAPDNIFSLAGYIAREQYPSSPLLYGPTPYSRPLFEEEFIGDVPRYSRYILEKEGARYLPFENNAKLNYRSGLLSHEDSVFNDEVRKSGYGYLISDYNFHQKLTPELDMWFPRITSRKVGDRLAYADWAGMTEETMDKVSISETVDSKGKYLPRMYKEGQRPEVYSYRPTYWQNLRYFIAYQNYYMYFRYLFWNFIGRQNNYHSNGEIEHGNFITGFSFIDNLLIGDTDSYPSEIWGQNPGRNRYFGIPFIIGVIGILWLLTRGRKSRRILTVITMIFLMTGIAIVVYLNQLPGEPRERDYTFLVSYMAFSMWISSGIGALAYCFLKFLPKRIAAVMIAVVSISPATLMALENFDDHDRRGRYEPTFFASSILDFDDPALIFSQGDNTTFPLWYSSEVLDKGKEHSIVDISYLALPSYVSNLKKQGKRGAKTLLSNPEMVYGAYLLTRIPPDSISKPTDLLVALEDLYKSETNIPAWQTSKIKIPVSPNDTSVINLHDFTGGSSYLSFRNLMLLDFLATQLNSENPKTLYFPYLIDYNFYQPLDNLLRPSLFGKIYRPGLNDSVANLLLRQSVEKELSKLENLNIKPHYADPVIEDRTRRYRGELIIAANELLNRKDTVLPLRIVEKIEEIYPYDTLLAGTFTMADSTYYEGKEFVKLLQRLYETTGDEQFIMSAMRQDSLMLERNKEWMEFYHALTPSQRKTLSGRSKRLLIK